MSEIRLDILAHADFSGRLRASKRCPGHAVFATAVDNIRRENPQGTVLLDAGDEFCTNFWGGAPMVGAVSLIGTDAMTLGNHEFDRGDAFLNDCIEKADFPILCANIHRRDTGELIPGTRPWMMLTRQGVKIGVLGLTTEYTPYMVTAASFAPFEAKPCAEAARRYIPEMRAAGAEVVVVLAHIPFYPTEDGGISGELRELLDSIPPVDVCIGGHIPGDYAAVLNDTVVLKGGFSGVSLCHAKLYFDTETRRVTRRSGEMHLTDWALQPQEKYKRYSDSVTDPFRDFFEKPLAYTDERWTIRLSYETRLGNYFAQCVEEAAGADFAYMNATSSGGSIEPGTVTAEDISAVMGFNDPIMLTQMTGAQIWELFELVYVPERYGNNAGLMFSGVVVHIDHTKSAWHKVQRISMRDGSPLEPDKLYTVASSEYMASGGNDTSQVAGTVAWRDTGKRVYDAIFDSLEKYGRMELSGEQRVHAIGTPENDNAPF